MGFFAVSFWFAGLRTGFAEGFAIGGGVSLRPLGRGFAGAVKIL